MIQEYIKDELQKELPMLEWTIDYFTGDDNTGTVYQSGGLTPDIYDTEIRRPTYQIWLRSSDYDKVRGYADKVFNKLHKKGNFYMYVDYGTDIKTHYAKRYEVFFIEAVNEPLLVGVNNGIMEYSLNFMVTLTELERLKVEYGFFNDNQVYKIRRK